MRKYLLVIPMLLAACAAKQGVNLDLVRGGRSSMRSSFEFATRRSGMVTGASAAVAGATLGTRLKGVIETHWFPTAQKDVSEPAGDIALVDGMVVLLDTDIQNLLNGADDRAGALENYISAISLDIQKAESRARILRDKNNNLSDDAKRLTAGVKRLKKDIGDAITKNRGRGIDGLMRELDEMQYKLSVAQTELSVTKELIAAYGDILNPMRERLEAIRQNRNAIIKGIKVIDLPGVEYLGILEVGKRRKRR